MVVYIFAYSSLSDNYHSYVTCVYLSCRCDKLLGLLDYWQRYEKEVNDLLSWIMDEANRFSKEVTTQGDKGIEDHIESCKVHVKFEKNERS